MNDKKIPNFIESYPNALSDDVCDLLIDMVDDLVTQNHEGVVVRDCDGRNDVSICASLYSRFSEVSTIIFNTIDKYMEHYSDKYHTNYKLKHIYPEIKLQKSSKGGGFTALHTEQAIEYPSRYAVWMIYLNDVVKGGATEFEYYNLKVQPTKGTLLIWPASYTHMHRAAPDLGQDKYIATGWFVYEKCNNNWMR